MREAREIDHSIHQFCDIRGIETSGKFVENDKLWTSNLDGFDGVSPHESVDRTVAVFEFHQVCVGWHCCSRGVLQVIGSKPSILEPAQTEQPWHPLLTMQRLVLGNRL